MQFYEDKNVERFSQITTDLSQYDYLQDQLRALSLQLVSQYSPILAAKFLSFKNCEKLYAYGNTGFLTKCRPKNVSLSAVKTPCGSEPVFILNGEKGQLPTTA